MMVCVISLVKRERERERIRMRKHPAIMKKEIDGLKCLTIVSNTLPQQGERKRTNRQVA